MKKFTALYRNGITRTISFVILSVFSLFIFQASEPVNNGYVDDPNLDQIPQELLHQAKIPKLPGAMTLVTVGDYDNWDLGVDFAEGMVSHNPQNVLWNFSAFNTNNAHYSMNGHEPWTTTYPGFPNSAGDPWTAYDSLGNLYYETMKSPVTGCWVGKSTNNGQSWLFLNVTAVNGADKNAIQCDQTSGPYRNYVYTVMTGAGLVNLNFSRSIDGGNTWTQTYTATPHNLPGGMIAVGPNGSTQGGTVIVASYSGSNSAGTYTFHRSDNGGATFTVVSSISGIGIIGTQIGGRSTINGARTRPYPWIAMDNSYGPYRGRLYLVNAQNDPPGDGNRPDVWLRYSADRGSTWSAPIRVNDNASPQNTHQWFPAIWCDKESGKLYITWYDTRNDPANNILADVYGTWSATGGTTFVPNIRVTNQSFTYPHPGCGAPCYRGDYNGVTGNPYTGMAVWYDPRNSTWGRALQVTSQTLL